MESMDKIYYSDKMFKEDMLQFKRKFSKPNAKKFDTVIAPARGGLTFGTKVSHMLDIPLGIIDYQRLDSNKSNKEGNQRVRMAIEPVGKNDAPFWTMKSILLVDDICDTGKSVERIYKFLKIVNPDAEITVICLFGNTGAVKYLEEHCSEVKLMYIHDNKDQWVVFGTWEDDFNSCVSCNQGEPCNRAPEVMTHCYFWDKSFDNFHRCEEYGLSSGIRELKLIGEGDSV